MKKLLLLFGFLCVASQMIAQDKIVPMYRIGGHYFSKELPMDEAFKISSSIMALADKDGNRVVNLLVGDDFKVPQSKISTVAGIASVSLVASLFR